jgi:hypothetical protein
LRHRAASCGTLFAEPQESPGQQPGRSGLEKISKILQI